MNRRHVERGKPIENAARVRQDEFPIVARVQGADPRIEELDGIHAGFDLGDEVFGDHVGQKLAEAVPGRRIPIHQRLGPREVARMAAFDGVRCQREGRSSETNQRYPPRKLALHLPDRVQHVRERFTRLEAADTVDVLLAPNRILDRRSLAVDEVEVDAHGLERQQQIGEENGGVHVDSADRLERDFRGEIGRAAQVEQ